MPGVGAGGAGPRDAGAVQLEGPPVNLGPEAAQSLAIGLHEMATNAVRHGALAAEDGALSISWKIDRSGDTPQLSFAWRERNVARTEAPERGFGISFVDTLLPRALDGDSRIAFDDGAMTWTMSFPVPATEA